MKGDRATSSIYFLLNEEKEVGEAEEDRARREPDARGHERPPRIDHHSNSEEIDLTRAQPQEDPHSQRERHLRGGHHKGTLAFITHPPSPPRPLEEWTRERLREAATKGPGWVHSALSSDRLLSHLRHDSPADATSTSSSSSLHLSSSSPAAPQRPQSADPHRHQHIRRRTSWPDPGTSSSSSSSTTTSTNKSELAADSNSLPTSPHVRLLHVTSPSSVGRGSKRGSAAIAEAAATAPSARVPSPPSPWSMSTYSSSSSFSSSSPYGSFSAPPSPQLLLPSAAAPPATTSPPATRLPSPPMTAPGALPSANYRRSRAPDGAWPEETAPTPPPAPAPSGDMSYDKCLQMWTKQTEQRRSHQRVKRWQEFLQRMKPGDAESGEGGGAERPPSSSPPQQWIRSRAKRKTAAAPTDGQKSESDGASTTKERKRKRRTKGREGEDHGRRGREDAEDHSPPEKEQEERPRSWDFHILQADDIRDQQEGGRDDHHGSSPAT